ncbi:MAG: hypothetical protein ABI794_19220 [Betaproteobacteria bacterium]
MREAMRTDARIAWVTLIALILVVAICLALAQEATGGPFSTGTGNFQLNLPMILAPIAVIGAMLVTVAAWFHRISRRWAAASAGYLVPVRSTATRLVDPRHDGGGGRGSQWWFERGSSVPGTHTVADTKLCDLLVTDVEPHGHRGTLAGNEELAPVIDLHPRSQAWRSGVIARPAILRLAAAVGTHAWTGMACQRTLMEGQQVRPAVPGFARRSRAPPLAG